MSEPSPWVSGPGGLPSVELLASTRSGWELLFIAVAGFVVYRMLERRRRGREADPTRGGRTNGVRPGRNPTRIRPGAAEVEDDAVAWWLTSGRDGAADHPGDDERSG